jgi:hypothetical protein
VRCNRISGVCHRPAKPPQQLRFIAGEPLFVTPSAVEKSLNFTAEIARKVSVRAELAYSLDMKK